LHVADTRDQRNADVKLRKQALRFSSRLFFAPFAPSRFLQFAQDAFSHYFPLHFASMGADAGHGGLMSQYPPMQPPQPYGQPPMGQPPQPRRAGVL